MIVAVPLLVTVLVLLEPSAGASLLTSEIVDRACALALEPGHARLVVTDGLVRYLNDNERWSHLALECVYVAPDHRLWTDRPART